MFLLIQFSNCSLLLQDQRNEAINDIVSYASFGDVKSFIAWLIKVNPDLMDEAIEISKPYADRLVANMAVQAGVTLTPHESAELLAGKTHLSQRAYKALKKSLKARNVFLASYKDTMKLINELPVGSVTGSCTDRDGCMCALADFKETLQQIFSCQDLVNEMRFPEPAQQKRLFEQLHTKFPALYGKMLRERPDHRTIFLRETGDNFRGAGRQPTEQDSFTVLNIPRLISSPAGQFVNGIWRGPETRELLDRHMAGTYHQMQEAVLNGVHLTLPDGSTETFNVVVFYVADYGHKHNILGRVQVNASYGCPHCKKPQSQWGIIAPPSPTLTTQEMQRLGEKGLRTLGPSPDKDSPEYKAFHKDNFGQVSPPLLTCFAAECNVSCALHTILAIHRQLWKHVDHVCSARNQQQLLTAALRAAGCRYMAIQVESFFASKKKHYDCNDHIKMTGEDCRLLEANIGKFVEVLCRGKPLNHHENRGLKNIVLLYDKFRDISKDLRSTSGNMARARTFQRRVTAFIKLFQQVETHYCTKRVMYMHALLDHIPRWMRLWCDLMQWGYGVFTSMSGEHLNKQLKYLELGHTDLSGNRYQQLLRYLKVRMFHFTSSVLDDPEREVTCSRCKQKGHNRKNKSCPMHPSQPQHQLSGSEEDEGAD